MQEERRLASALRHGDRQACGELIGRYGTKLYGLFLQLTGRRQASEDLVQETFLNIWRSLDKFRAQSSLSTWIYRIAMNCFQDHLRAESRNPTSIVGISDLEGLESNTVQPLHQTLRNEELGRLAQAVRQLPTDLKLPLVLRYYHGLSVRRVAAACGLSYGQTKFRLKKALESLRKSLET